MGIGDFTLSLEGETKTSAMDLKAETFAEPCEVKLDRGLETYSLARSNNADGICGRLFSPLLYPLDEAIASQAVTVIGSGSNGWVSGRGRKRLWINSSKTAEI